MKKNIVIVVVVTFCGLGNDIVLPSNVYFCIAIGRASRVYKFCYVWIVLSQQPGNVLLYNAAQVKRGLNKYKSDPHIDCKYDSI